MLFGAVSVLVVLATGDPGDGSSRAIDLALRTALVRDATVAVRAAEPNASDEQLEAMGTAAHASLLGVVSWSEHERRVVIRFTKLPYGGWADREVRFDAADAASERGRTVGFALASMMPADAFEEPAAAAPAAAPPLASVASVAWPAPAAPPVIEDRAASAPPRSNPLALDAAALAVAAPGGYGGGVGGTFAVRLPRVRALGARAAASARAESVGPAQASAVARRWPALGPRRAGRSAPCLCRCRSSLGGRRPRRSPVAGHGRRGCRARRHIALLRSRLGRRRARYGGRDGENGSLRPRAPRGLVRAGQAHARARDTGLFSLTLHLLPARRGVPVPGR